MVIEQDGKQADGHLLARGHQGVHFSGVGVFRPLAGKPQQPVGLSGHGRKHHNDLVAFIKTGFDLAHDFFHAVKTGHGGASEFLNQNTHIKTFL